MKQEQIMSPEAGTPAEVTVQVTGRSEASMGRRGVRYTVR
jgi:hypothetical protein